MLHCNSPEGSPACLIDNLSTYIAFGAENFVASDLARLSPASSLDRGGRIIGPLEHGTGLPDSTDQCGRLRLGCVISSQDVTKWNANEERSAYENNVEETSHDDLLPDGDFLLNLRHQGVNPSTAISRYVTRNGRRSDFNQQWVTTNRRLMVVPFDHSGRKHS